MDPYHVWNTSITPIRAKNPTCGCEVSAQLLRLCWMGKDYKKAADDSFSLWNMEKDRAIDEKIKRSHWNVFDSNRRAYLKHLETGERITT